MVLLNNYIITIQHYVKRSLHQLYLKIIIKVYSIYFVMLFNMYQQISVNLLLINVVVYITITSSLILMQAPVEGNDLQPNTALYNKINQTFGSYDKFKELFTNQATGVFGSGWAWLTATCDDNKKNQQPIGLNITTSKNQDIPVVGQAVLALDVFEHAYFLKYYNDRATYIKNFWSVIDWDVVNQNYVNACNKKIEKKDEL
eukprot:UN02690